MSDSARIALVKGDGIGVEVADAAMDVMGQALEAAGLPPFRVDEIEAGAGLFRDHGIDIEPGGEDRAGEADAIFLGGDRPSQRPSRRWHGDFAASAIEGSIPALCRRAPGQGLSERAPKTVRPARRRSGPRDPARKHGRAILFGSGSQPDLT